MDNLSKKTSERKKERKKEGDSDGVIGRITETLKIDTI